MSLKKSEIQLRNKIHENGEKFESGKVIFIRDFLCKRIDLFIEDYPSVKEEVEGNSIEFGNVTPTSCIAQISSV